MCYNCGNSILYRPLAPPDRVPDKYVDERRRRCCCAGRPPSPPHRHMKIKGWEGGDKRFQWLKEEQLRPATTTKPTTNLTYQPYPTSLISLHPCIKNIFFHLAQGRASPVSGIVSYTAHWLLPTVYLISMWTRERSGEWALGPIV